MDGWRRRCAAGLAAALVSGSAALADSPVVIELYTSQGCSSCPPADAFLQELAGRDDVLPLALHVDYWDYIGWPDTFGQAAFSRRQQDYARAFGERMVYTPQMVVGGTHHAIGARPLEVMDLVGVHEDRPDVAEIALERTGDRLSITGTAHGPGPFLVQLVRFAPARRVEIEAGENAGHTIDYVNIVTEWHAVAEWPGSEPLALEVDVTGGEPVAIIIQRPGPGEIVAAAVLE